MKTKTTWNKGNQNACKRIYCIELNQYFDSVIKASQELGINASGISKVLTGNRNKTGGLTFVYAVPAKEVEECQD